MIIDIVNYSLVIPQLCPLDKHFGSSPSADLDLSCLSTPLDPLSRAHRVRLGGSRGRNHSAQRTRLAVNVYFFSTLL